MANTIKIEFTKEFAGHAIGNVILTDMQTANFLLKKGVCEMFVEKQKEEVHKQPTIQPKKVVEKPKGRPKGTVKKNKK